MSSTTPNIISSSTVFNAATIGLLIASGIFASRTISNVEQNPFLETDEVLQRVSSYLKWGRIMNWVALAIAVVIMVVATSIKLMKPDNKNGSALKTILWIMVLLGFLVIGATVALFVLASLKLNEYEDRAAFTQSLFSSGFIIAAFIGLLGYTFLHYASKPVNETIAELRREYDRKLEEIIEQMKSENKEASPTFRTRFQAANETAGNRFQRLRGRYTQM